MCFLSSEAHNIGKKIAELKLELSMSDDDARQIELETKGQRNNKRYEDFGSQHPISAK